MVESSFVSANDMLYHLTKIMIIIFIWSVICVKSEFIYNFGFSYIRR